VGGIVVDDAGRVLLVKRATEPLIGRWSLPGGVVDVGETLASAVAREVTEETGLDVEVGPLVEVIDRIVRDADGRVVYHYVLIDYLCRPVGGTLTAGTDAADAVFAEPAALDAHGIVARTRAVIEKGLRMAGSGAWGLGPGA
jgi:ADP-ribose pyrophosphatase YjhB (NUDIX family)